MFVALLHPSCTRKLLSGTYCRGLANIISRFSRCNQIVWLCFLFIEGSHYWLYCLRVWVGCVVAAVVSEGADVVISIDHGPMHVCRRKWQIKKPRYKKS